MLLHWGIAFIIAVLVVLGLYIVRLPDTGLTTEKIYLVLIHKELGMWVLLAVLFRVIWRLYNVVPAPLVTIPVWQQLLAETVHMALYFFMFAMPITGWLMSSAGGYPAFLFGYLLPDLINYNYSYFIFYKALHQWFGYALIVTAGVHAGAALMHHFILKDNILRRMIMFWK